MVSIVTVLVSGSCSPGSSPGRGQCIVFLARHFILALPVSTQVYNWLPVNIMLGG